MQSRFSMKLSIFIDLILYTIFVLVCAFAIANAAVQNGNPLFIIALIAVAAALTVYTVHRIVRTVHEEIARRMNELSEQQAKLQAASASLNRYVRELRQRAATLNEYSDKMNDLAANIDSVHNEINTTDTS